MKAALYANSWDQARLIQVARRWLGTPFVPHACIPQAGVDCVQLVAAIYWETGAIDDRQFPDYTMDGGEHRNSSQVLEWLEASTRFERLTPGAAVQSGDIACFRMGRVPHHVGLILQPPLFIHAMRNYGVIESRLDDPTFAKRLMAVYRPVQ
ncbi:MAG: C40 family peptidase [Verrucomicrobia bacterium]|nr:C40 family peptidase [Verrucomicrobiota bacterium]